MIVTAADDLTLVNAARAGDRLAFGVLYLRHHAAAWRIACVASRFSPDAELAVIEGFTRVFSALPAESEEFEPGGVTFRPYLLACVRQAALDRARAAGRAEPAIPPGAGVASPPPPAPLAGPRARRRGRALVTGAPRRPGRPGRSAGAVPHRPVAVRRGGHDPRRGGRDPRLQPGGGRRRSTGEARAGVRAAQADRSAAITRCRADCRFTVDHLGAYHAGTLDPKKGVLVRSHLDLCPPCRMRLGELANAPATLAAAVPAAPLLGGEAQHTGSPRSPTSGRPSACCLPAWPPPLRAGTSPNPPLGPRSPDSPPHGGAGRCAGCRPQSPQRGPGGGALRRPRGRLAGSHAGPAAADGAQDGAGPRRPRPAGRAGLRARLPAGSREDRRQEQRHRPLQSPAPGRRRRRHRGRRPVHRRTGRRRFGRERRWSQRGADPLCHSPAVPRRRSGPKREPPSPTRGAGRADRCGPGRSSAARSRRLVAAAPLAAARSGGQPGLHDAERLRPGSAHDRQGLQAEEGLQADKTPSRRRTQSRRSPAKKDSRSKEDAKAGKDAKSRFDAKPQRKSEPAKESKRSSETDRRKQPVSRGRIVTA